jgi:hypothetical protein
MNITNPLTGTISCIPQEEICSFEAARVLLESMQRTDAAIAKYSKIAEDLRASFSRRTRTMGNPYTAH